MVTGVVRHLHSSSRFDRTPRSLRLAIEAYVMSADLITLTEVGRDTRAKSLRGLPGWRVLQVEGAPGADECAVVFFRPKWRLVSFGVTKLSALPVPDRGNNLIFSLDAVLQHRRTKQRLLVSVCHTPAHVEGANQLRPGPNSEVYRDVIAVWNTKAAEWRRRDDLDGVMLTGDWNLNFRKVWVREFFTERIHGLRLVWAARMPVRSTHGRTRVIDGTYTNLSVKKASVMRRDPSSDHAPFREVLAFPETVTP